MVVRYEMYQLRFIDRASVIPLMPSCCIYACVPRILEDRHTQCTSTTTLSDSYSIEVVRCQSRQQLLCAVLATSKSAIGGWLLTGIDLTKAGPQDDLHLQDYLFGACHIPMH